MAKNAKTDSVIELNMDVTMEDVAESVVSSLHTDDLAKFIELIIEEASDLELSKRLYKHLHEIIVAHV